MGLQFAEKGTAMIIAKIVVAKISSKVLNLASSLEMYFNPVLLVDPPRLQKNWESEVSPSGWG